MSKTNKPSRSRSTELSPAAVVTLEVAQVRAVSHREITHARELAAACF